MGKPAKKRYYFHGDVAENDANLIFCVRCDAFVNRAHFYLPDVHCKTKLSDYGYYKRSAKGFGRELKSEFMRPENARNIFA